ncbi:MAG: hypothetical protein ACK4TA_18050 [Saprospiraceae bacterium]
MRKLYWFLSFCAATLLACNQFEELDNLDGVQYDAEYAVPLVDTRLTLEDLLEDFEEDATLIVNADGSLKLVYRDEVVSQNSSDIFARINQSLQQPIPILFPTMPLPLSLPSGLKINRLNFKAGTLNYTFENRNNQPVNVVVTFPQITKNNVPLSFQASLPAYSGSGAAPTATSANMPISLEGYDLQAINNLIYIQYVATTPGGTQVNLSNFTIQLSNLAFSYAEGYFGNFLYEGTRDTLNIDFFDNWIRGDVYFENPRITLNVQNSFGIPTRARVNTLNVMTVKNQILPLESTFVTNGIDFPYPNMNQVGQVATGSFAFTKENSNIDVILGEGPVAVDYDVDAVTNPDNNTGIIGFITDSSFYKVEMEVELPLYGRASGFAVRDTIDLDFSNYDDVDDVEFKLVVDNRIPLDVAVQGYFVNANNVIIDSLLAAPQTLIQAAPVGSNGEVTGAQQKITFIPYDEARFARLRDNAERLWLNAAFSTNNNGATSVRVLSTQDVRIRLGAKLGVRN